MTESVLEKVAVIIAESKNISADEITLDTTFRELDIDSLAALSLIYDFEEAFNVSIPDQEVAKIQTVCDVVASRRQILPKPTRNAISTVCRTRREKNQSATPFQTLLPSAV